MRGFRSSERGKGFRLHLDEKAGMGEAGDDEQRAGGEEREVAGHRLAVFLADAEEKFRGERDAFALEVLGIAEDRAIRPPERWRAREMAVEKRFL
eukprot:gene49253-60295_t